MNEDQSPGEQIDVERLHDLVLNVAARLADLRSPDPEHTPMIRIAHATALALADQVRALAATCAPRAAPRNAEPRPPSAASNVTVSTAA